MSSQVDKFETEITTNYRRKLWSRFLKAIADYKLISKGDRIAVCISGGKDSMIMAKLFICLKKFIDTYDFEVKFLVMDPGYNEVNINKIKENLKILNIPAEIHQTDIFEIAALQDKSPCFLCAKMRRGALYNIAKSIGCNKIALGHHYDDVIETTLMNMLSTGSFQTMLPKLHSTNNEGMEVIRPMYLIEEKDLISFKNKFNLDFLNCACKFTEETSAIKDNGLTGSRREDIKHLIEDLEKFIPDVRQNIFNAPNNITLDMILGYKNNGVYHSYLEDYDKEDK